MQTEMLQGLLMKVRLRGSVQIHKKELFWMCGRKYEGETVYETILLQWEEIGGDRDKLHLFWIGDEYTLIAGPSHQISINYNTNWRTPGIAA